MTKEEIFLELEDILIKAERHEKFCDNIRELHDKLKSELITESKREEYVNMYKEYYETK